jgi:hypothetical protein
MSAATTGWVFSSNTQVHPNSSGQFIWPDVVIGPSGIVGVAWMDDHIGAQYHIFYSSSTDGGATWSVPERIDSRGTGNYSKFVSLAFTPSGIPVAVWEDDRTGAYNVYLSKRDPADGGTPWTANIQINSAGSPPSSSDFMNASLAVLDDNRYFVAWTDWREGPFHQVYLRGTWDGGVVWGGETRISDEIGYLPLAGDPSLIVDPASRLTPGREILYCVMNDWRGFAPGGRYPNVFFSRSRNGGAIWSRGRQVNDIEPLYQQIASHSIVRLADGALVAGWLNSDIITSEFRTSVSTDRGRTWGASVVVNDPAMGNTGTYSSIAASGNTVFAGYDVYQSDWNTFFRASYDGGLSWTDSPVRMDDDASGAASENTIIAASSTGMVHGVWQDTRPGLGSWKIYATSGVFTSAP